ncbi:MAG: dockerin type I repeat-containing protein [Armatimonadetes bacterium]|nr:dockerin type I repeat-containing protein [Armatimonadota bacterium]
MRPYSNHKVCVPPSSGEVHRQPLPLRAVLISGLAVAFFLGRVDDVRAEDIPVNTRPVSVRITPPETASRAIQTRPVSVQILQPRPNVLMESRSVSIQVGVPRYGDLDFNEAVNVQDAIINLQIAVKIVSPTVMQKLVGDVDLNNEVNVVDVIKILRVSVELDPPFPDFPK